MPRNLFIGLLVAAAASTSMAQVSEESEWIQLFNGQDMDRWIPKFTGFDLGENYRDTFLVEDGVLKVSYDNWPDFNNEFGHLFYDESFSHYLLRVEYRFIGEQVTNGPGWAFRNNGIMFHSQSPESMVREQEFPASIEAQMLGGNGSDPRPTGNVCSPGTHYVLNGELITQHCINSNSKTYHGDQWVLMELEVRGNELIRHVVNGELVFEYSGIQLDDSDTDGARLLGQGSPLAVEQGYIAIQAESHPIEFRTIELQPLDP